MNSREKEIFLRGLNVGIRIAEELETGLPSLKEKNVVDKVKKVKGKKVRWTEEEDEIIRRNANVSGKEMTALLPGREYAAVISRKNYLGVRRTETKIKNDGLAKLGQ